MVVIYPVPFSSFCINRLELYLIVSVFCFDKCENRAETVRAFSRQF
jgi:hypothetical protein